MTKTERDLGRLLQLAYSGELAAALAYRGHWKSLRDPEDRRRVQQIESEEWKHRDHVSAMLKNLQLHPDQKREIRSYCIGKILGFVCRIAGFFAPMYAAGKLESRNIQEYETAARLAHAAEHPEFIECLLQMAEVEWEHESFFRQKVLQHRWHHFLPLWPAPPPRDHIRSSFAMECSRSVLT